MVLDLMVRHGYLPQPQADAAYAEPIVLNPDPDRIVTWPRTSFSMSGMCSMRGSAMAWRCGAG